jgi:hypothetical protein
MRTKYNIVLTKAKNGKYIIKFIIWYNKWNIIFIDIQFYKILEIENNLNIKNFFITISVKFCPIII